MIKSRRGIYNLLTCENRTQIGVLEMNPSLGNKLNYELPIYLPKFYL